MTRAEIHVGHVVTFAGSADRPRGIVMVVLLGRRRVRVTFVNAAGVAVGDPFWCNPVSLQREAA